jgi:two-component system response regulator YesN
MHRVIIVDDEPKVSQLIKNLIDWSNLDLEHAATAHDGFTALELIKKHKPDIVITDIRMPGYDGIELIKHAKELYPSIDFIIISGYQHFDYAYNAIKYGVKDYFLKPLKKSEINATLEKIIKKYSESSRLEAYLQDDLKRLKDEFLRCIYYGTGKASFVMDALNKLSLEKCVSSREDCFQTMIFKPDFDYHIDDIEVMQMLIDKISKIVDQNLVSICSQVLHTSFDDRIFLIVNYKNENKKMLRKALNSIIDDSRLLRDFIKDLTVSIGLGGVYPSFEGVWQSADEAKKALIDRIVSGGGGIIQYKAELHIKKPYESIITYVKRQKLVGLTDVFDDEGIIKWIEDIEKDISKISAISGQFVLDTVNEILEIILYSIKNHAYSKSADKTVVDELDAAFRMQNNIRNIFMVLKKHVGIIIRQLAEEHRNEISRPIREAQKYINDNYASDMDLECISSIAGYNATYFSTLFKKETGMNFLEYMTSVRIKAAKAILSDSNKTILDVCHEVGYSDLKHFTKLFKKATGLNPSEYRKFHY